MQAGSKLLISLVAVAHCLGAISTPAAQALFASHASTMRLGEPAYPFCEHPVRSPFLAPTEDLSPLREPPGSGRLPFAPSVYIKTIKGPLVAKGEAIGFTIFSTRPDKADLGLRVTGKISRITSNGRTEDILKKTARVVKPGKKARIEISPSAIGIYRVDVRFERLDGTRLKMYKQYFRVAPSRLLISLGLSDLTAAPGESVIVRLENLGTIAFATGYGYWIERFTGSSWEVDQTMQDNRRRIKLRERVSPGGSFDCWRLSVPSEQSAGRYRISKRILGLGGPFVMREFTVEPSSS